MNWRRSVGVKQIWCKAFVHNKNQRRKPPRSLQNGLPMSQISIHHQVPSPQEYCDMRVKTGLSPKSLEGATIGMANSLYGVCLRDAAGELIGMGAIDWRRRVLCANLRYRRGARPSGRRDGAANYADFGRPYSRQHAGFDLGESVC